MNYEESKPSERLAAFVKCYWSIEYHNSVAAEPEPIVPDGCIEIVFDLADRFRQYDAFGDSEIQPEVLIAGQQKAGVLIGPTGNVSLFGVRFWPAGARHFFESDVNEFSGRIIDLSLIWGPSVRLVAERLAEAGSFAQKVRIVEMELISRLHERHGSQTAVDHAISLIMAGAGLSSIPKIARMAAISERSLERKFRHAVGLSPKSYSRIVRFQRVLHSVEAGDEVDVSDTAVKFGYYDQSHLINDFRQFSRLTPKEYLQRHRSMTEAFISAE